MFSKKSFIPWQRGLIVALAGVLIQSTSALNVEMSVKECAGVGSDGYPVRTIVPVQKGTYNDIDKFRLTDASGTTVPAQFEALSRMWAGDRSITNVAVTYMPIVPAFTGAGTGIAKYYLKDDGPGMLPLAQTTGLSVEDGSDKITVVSGLSLKFTVRKSGFNVIDEVWFDPLARGDYGPSNLVVKSNAKGGGEFIGRLGTQYDADRTDIKVVLEQSGPVEVVIRAEAVTKYSGPSDHTHGWAVRIYAYAGKPYIKVDYQIQNSAMTKKWGYPLYFHAMNLNLDLNLANGATVKAGLGNGSVYSGQLGSGVLLAQKKDSLFKVYSLDGQGDTSGVLSTGGRPDGYLDIDDGRIGITTVTRNFWRLWPNGLKVDGNNKLSVELFPEWSCQVNAAAKNPIFNSTHLYWLNDMQHVYKEVVLAFHGSGKSGEELAALAKTIDYHPVASLPVAYVGSAGSSLDMEGYIPLQEKISLDDIRRPNEPTSENLGWYYYLLNGRRINTSGPGGWPFGGGQFWATENPSDWFDIERNIIGELNLRPAWMAQYKYDHDFQNLHLGANEGNTELTEPRFNPTNWRAEEFGVDKLDSAVLANTGDIGSAFTLDYCTVMGNSHYWTYHISDGYWITGNRWERDWFSFLAEFRKFNLDKVMFMARSGAHPAADAFHAYQITGDTTIITLLKQSLTYNRGLVRPQYGDCNMYCCGQTGAASWQAGFGMRPLIDLMAHIKDSDPAAWAQSFQLVSGFMSWNLNYGNFGYNIWAPAQDKSTCGSFTFMDPQAWYYWNTGKEPFLAQLNQYIDSGIGGGDKPCVDDGTSWSTPWNGAYSGRWTQLVRTRTAVPPAPITNLRMTRSGNQCKVSWIAPEGAVRYHIVYSDKPIAAEATTDSTQINWWAANVIGPNLKPRPGQRDSVVISLPDTGYRMLFAYVFTFDNANNMSIMVGNGDVAVEEEVVSDTLADGFSAIPNPFNPSVSFTVQGRLNLAGTQLGKELQMSIFDVKGQCVAVLDPTAKIQRGPFSRISFHWNAQNRGSGFYVARIAMPGKTWEKKVTLIK